MQDEQLSGSSPEPREDPATPQASGPGWELPSWLPKLSFLPTLLALLFVLGYGALGIGRDMTPRIHDLRNGSACVECHTGANPAEQVASEPDGCYRCHSEAEARAEGHHPIDLPVTFRRDHKLVLRDGKMICSTCHDPHGKTRYPMLLRRVGNGLCTSCHDLHSGPHDTLRSPADIENQKKK